MKQFKIIASASLLIFLTGCTTKRIVDYQPASPSVSERTAQESGLEVALDPFVESARTKQYFDIDAVAEGLAILHVRVTNKTADQTFLVEKTHFSLLLNEDSGGLTGGNKIERSSRGVASKLILGGGVGPLTGANLLAWHSFGSVGGMARNSKFTEIQRNLTGKEMADATLSPGKSMEGFIYFMSAKKGEDWTRTAAVQINLSETKTQQTITLSIPLSH